MSAIDVDLQDCARALQRAHGQLVDAYTIDAESPSFEDNNGLGRSVATLGGFVRELAGRVEVPLDGEARVQPTPEAASRPPGRSAKAHETLHPKTITITLPRKDLVRLFYAGGWGEDQDTLLSQLVSDNAHFHTEYILSILSTHEHVRDDDDDEKRKRVDAVFHITEQSSAAFALVQAIATAERGTS